MSHDRGCSCGRERDEYEICPNKYCNKKTQNMIMKTEAKRYVWIRADGEVKIIDTDIIELWQGPYFDREKDHIYELGNEVEIKISVNVKNKTAYR